ncbi:hypothetical protein NMG60_11027898 [Bertholletia excelsa]
MERELQAEETLLDDPSNSRKGGLKNRERGERKRRVMDEELEAEETLLDHPSNSRKGGLRTMPFIIVNESFERLASTALMPNMIFYLLKFYDFDAVSASVVLALWSALSNGLAIVGAFLADSYLGRFRVITLGSISSLLGTTLLWLTSMIPQLKPCDELKDSCHPSTPVQLAVLYSAFGLISIGAGCIRPCSIAFGADQLDNKENPNNERVLQSFFNWYYASTGISTIIALTIFVYIQDHLGWQVGFAVPAVLMVLSAIILLLGTSLFIKVRPRGSLLTELVQVLVVAVKKRNITLPPLNYTSTYHVGHEPKLQAPTENLRWLNKACIITDPERDLNPDGSTSDSWNLCTVDQVESLKALLKVIPMWSTSFMVIISLSQTSYTTLQAETMDRHITSNFEIPAGSMTVFMIVTITIWVAFYDRIMVPILARYMGRSNGLSPQVRMGIGLLISCLAMVISGVTECVRRRLAIEEGFEDNAEGIVDMSAMWLVPQYVLLGLAEALNAVGQIEFFYSLFPKSMSSIGVALYTFGMAVAALLSSVIVEAVDIFTSGGGKVSWLSTNINKGHLDYYYWLLAFLGLVNFVYFLMCTRAFWSPRNERKTSSQGVGGQESDFEALPSA